MNNFFERLALDNLHIHGKFEIVTKDELTGRVYQRVEDENVVHDVFYHYLRYAALATMANMSSTTNLTTPPVFGASPSLGNFTPFNRLLLTDGLLASGEIDPLMGIDGNVLAYGYDTANAASGSIYGTATVSEWYAINQKIYKRWDWSSANGNGIFSKIMTVCMPETMGYVIPSITAGMDLNWKTAPTVTLSGTLCGGQTNDHWYVYSISTTSLVLRKIALTSTGLVQTDYTITASSPTFQSNSYYHLFQSNVDTNIMYLVSIGSYTDQYVHKINLSTLTLTSKTYITTTALRGSYGIVSYIDSSDNIYLYGYGYTSPYYGLYRYIFNTTTLTLDAGTQITTLTSAASIPQTNMRTAYVNGNYLYMFQPSDGTISVINLATGEHTVSLLNASNKITNGFSPYYKGRVFYNYGTTSLGLFKYNGYYYQVTYFTSAPYYQYAKYVPNLTPDFLVTTSRLLTTPITKTSAQSMYVGYTLEFS